VHIDLVIGLRKDDDNKGGDIEEVFEFSGISANRVKSNVQTMKIGTNLSKWAITVIFPN
jgi:hypothetical protein